MLLLENKIHVFVPLCNISSLSYKDYSNIIYSSTLLILFQVSPFHSSLTQMFMQSKWDVLQTHEIIKN